MIGLSGNRRTFLSGVGTAMGAVIAAPWDRALAAGTAPELVIYNAKVYTVDPTSPRVEAFAIRAGRFVATGTSAEMRALAGPGTKSFDARGMTIVPGFIDCHTHLGGETILYDELVGNLYDVQYLTIEDILERLRARAFKTPPGLWVEGFFFDDTKVKGGRTLTADDLDKVSKDRPVAVYMLGGHTSYYNSKALELAGVRRDTPDPFGGTYGRLPDGRLSGRATDAAHSAMLRAVKRATFSDAEKLERIRKGAAFISKQYVRNGVTSVCQGVGDTAAIASGRAIQDLRALQDVRAAGDLLHRVSYEPYDTSVEALVASGIETGFGDEWIRVGATFEHLTDGSFSERTMSMSTPFPGSNPPYYGNVMDKQDGLNAWAERVHRAGFQMNCHANGDVAIGMVLTAYERALKLVPRAGTRPKITHCTLVNPELLRRIKAIGAVPTLFSTALYYNSDKFVFYDKNMLEHCVAYRSMIDMGIIPAAGSDFFALPLSPLMAIQGMVTRTGWDGKIWGASQRITVDEALKIYTYNGAYNTHEEGIKGSITPGKLADYVVLADDIHTVDPMKIKDIRIAQTVTGGRIVYES